MKIHEIARATGLGSTEIAEELGVKTGSGVAMRVVDDKIAATYIASKGEAVDDIVEPLKEDEEEVTVEAPKSERRARFWSPSRNNILLTPDEEVRKHIAFSEWFYETEPDSAEAKFLKLDDIRDRIRVFEVQDGAYKNDDTRLEFMRYLESFIYTGQTPADGVSKEGRNCILAILPTEMADSLPKTTKNTTKLLIREIARMVHLNVEAFGNEG